MSQQLPIPERLWDTIPADAQAALLDAWNMMEDRIAELEAIARDLQARLGLNSTNSSKPPSSDPHRSARVGSMGGTCWTT
jgi:hypothetical protein